MARALTFSFNGAEFDAQINRVDRGKLYGSVEVQTVDPEGGVCTLATLAADGQTLIGYGGTAFGYLNDDGEWIDRKELTAVDIEGEALQTVPSSFDLTTSLDQVVSVETYLDHSIRLCYALDCESEMPPELLKSLGDGAIYQVPFSYRGGVNADRAFLMTDEQNQPWLMIAEPSDIESVALEQAAMAGSNRDGEEDEVEDETADSLDFSAL